MPEGIWTKCEECNEVLYRDELKRNLEVCPKCSHHMYIGARDRLLAFLDADTGEEVAADVRSIDILKFRDTKKYKNRLSSAKKKTGEEEALIAMRGRLSGLPVVATAFEFNFIGGSMGSAVGERFARAVEEAIEHHATLINFSASGGARMQEALFSLMQMAKCSAMLTILKQQRLPYISVLTNPTMGGVSASIATLGDVNIAEPNALIGFAGPRVIEQTVREQLPSGFQRSEFLLKHGGVDAIIDRRELHDRITKIITILTQR